jgi:hypothetical protein
VIDRSNLEKESVEKTFQAYQLICLDITYLFGCYFTGKSLEGLQLGRVFISFALTFKLSAGGVPHGILFSIDCNRM